MVERENRTASLPGSRSPQTLTGSEAPKLPQRPGGAPVEIDTTGMNAAWDRAVNTDPGWKAITLRFPGSAEAPWTFSIEKSHRGRRDLRSTLVLDRQTAAVVRHETFDIFNAGRRARSWLRFIHTGEAGGFTGQTVAGIASAGGFVLVWTGISLALRRFRNTVKRRSTANTSTPEYKATP